MTMYSLGIPVYGSRPQAIVMSRVEFDEEG